MDNAWAGQHHAWETRPGRPLTRHDAIGLLQTGRRYRFGVPDLDAGPPDASRSPTTDRSPREF